MNATRIGIVVVGHGELAPAMVCAASTILGGLQSVIGVAIDSTRPVETNRLLLEEAIASVNNGAGVILLSDMFGGTPSNICLAFLDPSRIEVISGVNLPMLIKLAGDLQTTPFNEVVAFIQQYGQKNIVNASHILEGKLDAHAE